MADFQRPPQPSQYQRPNYSRPNYARGQVQAIRPKPIGIRSPNSGGQIFKGIESENDSGTAFSSVTTLMGLGTRDYAFGLVPRGYGFTLASIGCCYALLRWEKNRIEKTKKRPPFMTTNTWFSRQKTAEREYSLARGDFPKTTMLMLIGGLGMPYAAAIGGVFWILGRGTDFHKMEKRDPNDNTEPVFSRFGKFLMICGIFKFTFDLARGRLTAS